MRLMTTAIDVPTKGPGLIDITAPLRGWVTAQRATDGQLTLFIRHTSASLVVQENADPDVLADLETFMRKLAPWEGRYRHRTEGPDDMPAHIRAALTQTSLTIPVIEGAPALGTWQGVYVWEHRAEAQIRHVIVQLLTT